MDQRERTNAAHASAAPGSGRRTARKVALVGILALALVTGCDDGPGTGLGEIVRVEVSPASTLLVGVGDTVTFEARVIAPGGEQPQGARVDWRSLDPAVVDVAPSGRATAVGAGTTTLVASSGGVEGAGSVEVWIPPETAEYLPGESYFGRADYVEYIPGRLPVVMSAPHGGSLEPTEIPDRTYGTVVTDRNTRETLLAVRRAFRDRTGLAPHVVISHLRRTKLDPNRELEEAAQGSPFAENAWAEFHGFIETAKDRVAADFGTGLYLDLHGHSHDVPRVEIGLLLSAADLARPDALLDALAASSSIRALAARAAVPFHELVRGPTSLGGLLSERGVRTVPGPDDPDPGGEAYFSGGYDTRRHGSLNGGTVDGMQLELHYPGIRDTDASRAAFGGALAGAAAAFLSTHYGFRPGEAGRPGRSSRSPAAAREARLRWIYPITWGSTTSTTRRAPARASRASSPE